jgi:hypothetical protein
MRKVMISLAAAASALAFAAPAAAQYLPVPQAYGYNGYGNGYGYNGYGNNGYGYNNYGQARALQYRIDQIQRDISRLAQVRAIGRGEYEGLISESRNVEYVLQRSERYGFSPQQRYAVEVRIANLEQHVRREVRDGYNGYGNNNYRYGGYTNGYGNNGYGYNGYNNGYGYSDRDRDGRDDRYEDDRGTRRD